MKITPLDIEGHTFKTKMRGLDPEEVRSFLRLVSEEYEKVFAENIRLKEEVAHMEGLLSEHRDREKTLRETLVTAQRMSDEIKGQARREAAVVVKEAELNARKLVERAQQRSATLEASLGDLRIEQVGYLKKIRALLEHHLKLLELHEQEAAEDEKVHVMRPREASESS